MNYEEENEELAKQLKELSIQIEQYKAYFESHPNAKTDYNQITSTDRVMLEMTAQKMGIYSSMSDSDEYLVYKILCAKYEKIKYRLSQGKAKRALVDGVTFVDSITPQHVSGKVYKVENSDGCGMFILWFLIIDFFILLIMMAVMK